MENGIEVILMALFILSVLGILMGLVHATWNLFKHNAHLPVSQKRKKWFRDFWLTWFDIVLMILEAF